MKGGKLRQVEDTHRPRTSAWLPGGRLRGVYAGHQGATPRGRHATAALVTGERRCRMRGVGENRHGYESKRGHACGSPEGGKQTSACKWWRLDGARWRLHFSSVGGWPQPPRASGVQNVGARGSPVPNPSSITIGRWVATTSTRPDAFQRASSGVHNVGARGSPVPARP